MAFCELLGSNDPKQMNQLKVCAFDGLLEYLDSKFSPISDSGFRTCTKLPSSITKVILIADIIDEVKEWTQFVAFIPDELIEWDMSHSLDTWMCLLHRPKTATILAKDCALQTQVFVQCMPNTRSSGQLLLPINPEPQLIGRMDAQRDIERRAAQQEKAILAALAAAQVHQQNIDNPWRATNPDDEDLGEDELLNPRRDAEVATPANRRDRQARFRPECRAMQMPFDDDVHDLDGAGAMMIGEFTRLYQYILPIF
ncbi:hypothetical protein CQW23_31988 [Capsicum baccatum]|uniref:Uncharacterized protein n=1 Tax=Capsicum baccatum TaxID=33114 RepID=A0A2G2V626_CAPBA|nr:hypothetical protein CQW23_31988 [Capsicum baccatum]